MHQAVNASGPSDPIPPPPQGPTRQEDNDAPPELDRANVVAAFVASPLLLEPTQLKVDHIATLLALAADGPWVNKLLAPPYS